MKNVSNPQDRETIRQAVDACNSPEVWTFITANYNVVIKPTERERHWGLVCGCPEHKEMRDRGVKHIECKMNSRRLKNAWEFIEHSIADTELARDNLTPDACDGSNLEYNALVAKLNRKISGLKLRFGYLKLVPWSCSQCESVEGCREVMAQIRSRPLEDHDPLTRDTARRLGGDIDSRAQGGDLSPALAQEVAEINMSPLGEDPGEGYHRGSTHENTRAPASSTHHIVQNNRASQELERARSWVLKYGDRGRQVVRFEWRSWTRVLQTRWERRWIPKKLQRADALAQIYHESPKFEDDWTALIAPEEPARPVETEQADSRDQLESEYIAAVLRPDQYYAVPARVETINPEGQPVAQETKKTFQVVSLRGSHSRPHLMPTFRSADEPALYARCAVEVLPVDPVPRDGEHGDPMARLEGLVVHAAGDSYWTSAVNIAPFDDLAFRLETWRRPEGVVGSPGCTALRQVELAKPLVPITDDACPTISIVSFLQKKQGWVPVPHTVTHTDLVSKEYDSREKLRMKKYYITLAYLSKTLPLTSSIPSQQPVNFYKCLLAGIRVEPHLGDKFYFRALNDKLAKDGKPLLPLPPPEGGAPPALTAPDDDDGVMVFKPEAPPAKKRKDLTTGRSRSPPGGKAKAKPPATPPPPSVLPITEGLGTGSSGSGGGPPPSCPPPVPVEPLPVEDDSDDDAVRATHGVDTLPRQQRQGRIGLRGEFKPGVGNARIMWDPYVTPAGIPAHNWIIQCPHHDSCWKSKGPTARNTARFGAIEPLALLHVWPDLPLVPGKTHRALEPPKSLVEQFAKDHAVELQAIVDREQGS